jgi:hypothetical protein
VPEGALLSAGPGRLPARGRLLLLLVLLLLVLLLLVDEAAAAVASPSSSPSSSALARDSSICLRCASKRDRASAYCRSHSSRCDSKPGS